MKKQLLLIVIVVLSVCLADAQTITKAEYYINTDPGVGNGTNVPISASTLLQNQSFNISLAALSDGLHQVYFRMRDSNGYWGTTSNPTPIYKYTYVTYPATPAAPDIIGAEYFVDTDPGAGSGTSVSIGTPATSLQGLSFNVVMTSLTDGIHQLYFRMKDANGNWGTATNTSIYKYTATVIAPPPPTPTIVAAEYYVDTDPGFGGATSIPITPSTKVNNISFITNVSSLTDGNHTLFVRLKDANGAWGASQRSSFSVCSQAVPVASAATAITTSGFTANWAAASGATGYTLDVSADNFATFVTGYNAKSVTGLTQTVTGLSAGVAYSYRVSAVNTTCTSVASNVVSATTLFTTPSANAATAITSLGFTANWAAVSGATGYLLDISTDNFATFIAGYSGKSTTALSEVVTGLTSSTSYQYRVRATNGVGTSASSGTITAITAAAIPVAPVATAATAISSTSFTANWASVAGATGYVLDLSTDNFSTFVSGYNGKSVTGISFTITNLTANTAYKYRLRASNTAGTSGNSNSIDVSTLVAAPVVSAATAITASGFTANWAAVTGATGYQLDISTDNFATFIAGYNSKSITGVSEPVTGLTASTAYKYRVRATNANGSSANSNAIDVTTSTAKQNQTITFAALPAKTFGDVAFTLTASVSSQLAVSYASSNTSVATVSGNTVTIIGAGTSTITASQAGNDSYNPASNVAQTLTVNKANQTITFAALPAKSVTDAAFTLTATGGASGLPVTFVSSNSSVATINGNTVTIVGAGNTTITASQAGNANYNAAADVTQTLTVNAKQSQTITFAALAAKTFGDAPFTLGATASSQLAVSYASSNTAVATVSGNTMTIVGAGTSTITASQAGNDTFNPAAVVTQTLTVNKANQTITFDPLPTKNVGDAAFTLTAIGGGSGLPITFTSSNAAVATVIGYNTVVITGAGTSTITANQAGNANYNAAAPVAQLLTATAKPSQVITFAALPAKTFGDAAFTLTATGGASGLPVTFASSNTSVASISGSTVTIVGAGTTTITASQAGNDNFLAATDVPQTLTVNKASQTITFAALPAKSVGSVAFALTATGGASGLPVTFVSSNTSVATISGSTVTILAAGTTTITASQAGNANYNAAVDVAQTLTVNAKQNQTITFAALADKLITDNPFALTATASSGLAIAYSTTSDKITISGSQVTLIKAGRASIVANQAGNDSFNAATSVTQSFCVKPTKPTITLTNNNTETVTLNSSASAGNQWYLAGAAISGATNATLAITAPGVYKVQVKVDDCISEFSADQTILVTGDIKLDGSVISISPNPVDGVIQLNGIVGEIKSNQLFDITGRASSPLTLEKKNEVYQASVEHLTQGVYVLRILQENKVVQLKFVKK